MCLAFSYHLSYIPPHAVLYVDNPNCMKHIPYLNLIDLNEESSIVYCLANIVKSITVKGLHKGISMNNEGNFKCVKGLTTKLTDPSIEKCISRRNTVV